MAPTLRAFSSIHNTQRLIFSKMLDMNIEITLAKKIVALSIALSQLDFGFKHFFDQLVSLDINHPHFLQVIFWANNFLSSLVNLPQFVSIGCPSNDGYNVHIVSCQRDSLYRGLHEGLYGIYKVLFDDILEERGLREKKLNPNAKEWCPRADVAEESRFLYLTFSKGFPLTCYQIRVFFTWWFGPYVETIYVHKRGGGSPLFGKIVFKFSFVPHLILNGRDQAQFMINGRTLRCKKYRTRINPGS